MAGHVVKRAAEKYHVLVRLDEKADRQKVAIWCHRDPSGLGRRRSISMRVDSDQLADLSHQPWVKAISLSEDLQALSG
jgi:hypothetical protein